MSNLAFSRYQCAFNAPLPKSSLTYWVLCAHLPHLSLQVILDGCSLAPLSYCTCVFFCFLICLCSSEMALEISPRLHFLTSCLIPHLDEPQWFPILFPYHTEQTCAGHWKSLSKLCTAQLTTDQLCDLGELTTLSFSILMCNVNYWNISNAWSRFMHNTVPGINTHGCWLPVHFHLSWTSLQESASSENVILLSY